MSNPRGTVPGMTTALPATLVLWCTTCGDDVAFEQPGCLDGHGTDCPEWVCTQCGAALLVGFAYPETGGGWLSPGRQPTSDVA